MPAIKGPRQVAPAPAQTPAGLLTEQQLANFLGLSFYFLREDRRGERRIPFIKLGTKAVRYSLPAVMAALAATTYGGPQVQTHK